MSAPRRRDTASSRGAASRAPGPASSTRADPSGASFRAALRANGARPREAHSASGAARASARAGPAALACALALLTLGCGPQRRRWRPLAAPTAAVSAFAVVGLDTPLRTAPSPRAPAVQLAPPGARTPWEPREVGVFRLLGERGGWAELESPGPLADGHCAPPGLRAVRLRLFVPSAALVPVTVRDVEQRFGDDTSIRLRRGVPVTPLRGTRLYRARLGPLSAVVRLAGVDIGTRYLPAPAGPPPPPSGYVSGQVFRAGGPILGQTGRVRSEAPQAVAHPYYGATPRGPSEQVVELRPDCAVLRVRVSRAHLAARPDLLVARAGGSEDGAVARLAPGTPLFWEDGRPAGEVAELLELAVERPRQASRRCFAYRPPGAAAPIGLCAPVDAVGLPGDGLGGRLATP